MFQGAEQLVGICGIYCGTCPYYLAGRENDQEQLARLSQLEGVPIEDLHCDGCLSDRLAPHCVGCRAGFRGCADQKQVTWCFQCPDFPCRRLEDFREIHVVNGISHHARVIEELTFLKERGLETWLAQQDQGGRCPRCGKRLYWFTRHCPVCQSRIR